MKLLKPLLDCWTIKPNGSSVNFEVALKTLRVTFEVLENGNVNLHEHVS